MVGRTSRYKNFQRHHHSHPVSKAFYQKLWSNRKSRVPSHSHLADKSPCHILDLRDISHVQHFDGTSVSPVYNCCVLWFWIIKERVSTYFHFRRRCTRPPVRIKKGYLQICPSTKSCSENCYVYFVSFVIYSRSIMEIVSAILPG